MTYPNPSFMPHDAAIIMTTQQDATNRPAWTETTIVDVYLLAKKGFTDAQISETLGFNYDAWVILKRDRPGIRETIERARADANAEAGMLVAKPDADDTVVDYIYGHLPADLRKLWDEIDAISELDHHKRDTSFKELKQYGKAYQQVLFIHALCLTRFDYTRAMKKVGLTLRKYKDWLRDDPTFKDLVEEIQFHKKNFCENALLDQVQMGETSAVIFANKTLNRDRGYGEKIDVAQSVSVSGGTVERIEVSEMDLTVPMKRALLEAAKEARQGRLEGPSS